MKIQDIMKLRCGAAGWRKAGNGDKWLIAEPETIGNDTDIGVGTFIGENTTIGIGCKIGARAFISADVVIGDGLSILDDVRIGNGVVIREPMLQLEGEDFVVYPSAPGLIGIGCEIHSLAEWEEVYVELADEHGIDAEGIATYRRRAMQVRDWMIEAELAGTFIMRDGYVQPRR